MRSSLSRKDIQGRMKELVEALFINIPSGVGSHRKDLKLNREEERRVLKKGARWAVEKGFGTAEDLGHIEEQGSLKEAIQTVSLKGDGERESPVGNARIRKSLC